MNKSIFKYEYNGAIFDCIGQPIVRNSNGLIDRVEILSRNKNIKNIEFFFNNLEHLDIVNIACKQVHACCCNMPAYWIGDDKFIHINIDELCLKDPVFLSNIENTNGFKFAFEIDGCNLNFDPACRGAFDIIRNFGHEVWLDDFGIKDKNLDTLLKYCWDGVKIDKSILWRSSKKQMMAIVGLCYLYVDNIILEGIEDNSLKDTSLFSGADFSQGFFWPSIEI